MRLDKALLSSIPEPLQPRITQLWQHYLEQTATPVTATPLLLKVWCVSDFVAQHCIRDPALLTALFDSGDLDRSYQPGELRQRLVEALAGVDNEAALGQQLRLFRRREMVRIAWRDIAGLADLATTTGDLSDLADSCCDLALQWLYPAHCQQWGTPQDAAGAAVPLVVLGMGKLGAYELNFSSDIDLMFAYEEDGETVGGRRAISHQEFFIRLGQRLINALHQVNAWGYVFRVDMRLRPFGDASALALSFDAMEEYYQVHGREWERYALIKARPVAGDIAAGERLLQRLRPFIYRRYIDFGAFESLREMKQLIVQEVRRKGLEDNVKLGHGGIREVEFIGQAFQLIRGGREPRLQQRPILPVLAVLQDLKLLPHYVVSELSDAYTFLRHSEHRLQQLNDQQTQQLPVDLEQQQRVALGMGFADWPPFLEALRQRMASVAQHFEQVFAAPQTDHADSDPHQLHAIWQQQQDPEQAAATLTTLGFDDPVEALRRLAALRDSSRYRALSARGRERMDRLIPLLIGAVGGGGDADATLREVLTLLEAITRRTAYLALLVENPMALSQLVRLCGASPWIARLLSRHPQLLDELLDPRTLYAPPHRAAIANDLRQRLARLPVDDQEAQMDALRHTAQSVMLRVAAADVVAAVPLMVVSDHLTELAEVILDEALELAWHHLVARHGRPQCGDDQLCDKGFAVIGYGKLGGIELGYSSDLDIVFLHSDDASGRLTDGPKPVENSVFYARLAQRLIHLLNTRTAAGQLYEIDLRLRPSGNSGLLVSGVSAFAEYQRSGAWTWEHQALVRARYIAGDPTIAAAFEAIRTETLSRRREANQLRDEVAQMREKMRDHLAKGGATQFDLKQDRGGIADIEFIVQYGVLQWSADHPALLRYSDNIRLLAAFAQQQLLPAADCDTLADVYRQFRAAAHRLTLHDEPARVAADQFVTERDGVSAIWDRIFGSADKA